MTDLFARPGRVLMLVGSTVRQRRRSGIHRVTIETARALADIIPFDLVCWDHLQGDLRYLDWHEIEAFFGGSRWPTGLHVRRDARALGRRFKETLAPTQDSWLFVPEVAWHSENGSEILCRIMTLCREWGVSTASIFYDLIPIQNSIYAGGAALHEAYVAELVRSDVIVPISTDSGSRLEAFWRERRVSPHPPIVPLLLPDGGFRPKSEDRRDVALPRQRGVKHIALIGTVEPRKRQLQFLLAMERARRRSEAVRAYKAVVIGSLHPYVADAFNALAARSGWISYLDYVPDREIARTLEGAAFSAFISDDEGYGLPISESLSAGTPCLCADFGAMAEIAAGGGCFKVDVRDDKALESAIVRLCEDESLLNRLRTEIQSRPFATWSDYARKLVAIMGTRKTPVPATDVSAVRVEGSPAHLSEKSLGELAAVDVLGFDSETDRASFVAAAAKAAVPDLLPSRMPIGEIAEEAELCGRARGDRRLLALNEDAYAKARRTVPRDCRTRPIFLRVLISTFNRRDFVVANVKWILKNVFGPQDEDVDLLVVDGGSEDGTLAALGRIADPRFRFAASPANVGMLAGLREAGRHLGAEYLWVIGDDDYIIPEVFRRVLAHMREQRGVPLGFVNFSVYHRSTFAPHDRPEHFISEAQPLARAPASTGLTSVSRAAEQTDNLFTAIYAIIWRADVFGAAYDHRFDGDPFSSLTEAIPCSDLILRRYADCEAVWIGEPAIAGNAHNSWSRHRPLWHGIVIPQALALAREAGVDKRLLQNWADTHHKLLREALDIAKREGRLHNLDEGRLTYAASFFRLSDPGDILA